MILLAALMLVLIIIAIAALVLIGGMRTRGHVERALNMTLFLIRVPRGAPDGKETGNKNEKELISVSEQLLAGFSNIHSGGWNKFIYGEPYLSLEVAVHHTGEETHFYIAVPKSSEDIIEKQIYSIFPAAEVSKTKDYNIFNPQGSAAGAYFIYAANPILPIRTYQKLETDPMSAILTAMSKLQAEGEGAAMQVLIRPSHSERQKSLAVNTSREMQAGYQFKDALQRAIHPPKPKTSENNKPTEQEKTRAVTPADEEVIKAVSIKASKQNFDVNIRILTSAASELRAKQILKDLEGSFVQFSLPDLNTLNANELTGRALDKLAYNFSFRLFDNKQSVTMSTEEIASFYHLPVTTTAVPRVSFLKAKLAEPPPNLSQQGVVIGRNIFRGQAIPIHMADEDRRRHLYIIGQTGTGKSTLMKAMIRQDIENGKGVCLVDPHGEFAEFALSIVPQERAGDVIYFDPGDIERPMGLNMLEMDPKHPEQKTMIIDELFGIMDKLYNLKETGGPMFEKYFKNSLYLLLDDYEHEVPTLSDISRVLNDDDYRADKLSRESNPLVREFWQLEAEKATGEQSLSNFSPYITSKLNNFVFNEFLRPIINQKKSAFNFREVMDRQKILIANLSKGKIGDLNANFIGMLIVGKLLRAALSRIDIQDEMSRNDFYLYMDEFQNFTTDSIATILSEARKYRLNLVIANQFIKQLKENIKDAVLGNVGSIISFRIGPDDAELMKNKFEPVFSPQDLSNIDNLNAYANLLVNGQTARPFNISIETEKVFKAGSAEMAAALRETSRLKYGRPKEEVEHEIMKSHERGQGLESDI